MDGIETTFGNFGSPDNVSQPSVEAVQEFTASVLTSRAEFGGMGTITTATKSGANQFHGGLFWYLRNSATDARNTFATVKPFQNMHNYGGTIGGPIRKDKTFFFFDFDGLKGVSATLFTPNVPTTAMRLGDFSAFAALKNPYTGVNPFIGNSIAPAFLSSQALKAQELFFPLPNFGAPTLTAANYRASFDGPEVHRTEEIKLDHNFSERHRAFLRYENHKDDYDIPGARSALPPTTVGTSYNRAARQFLDAGRRVHDPAEPAQRSPRGRGDSGLGQHFEFPRPELHAADRNSGTPRPRADSQSADFQRLRILPATTSIC